MAEAKKTKQGEDDRLSRLVDWFEEADESQESGSPAPRFLQQRDIDYYDCIQLTEEEVQELKKRGQPDTTFNFIGPKIDFLIGLEAQSRTDPKAYPRNPKDEETGEAATDALRYVGDKCDLDELFSNVWENMLKPGYGGCEVIIERTKRGTAEIRITQPDWDRTFYDPHSKKRDFTDARYMGYVVWWDRDQAMKKWPGKSKIIEGTVTEAVNDSKLQDKPTWKQWVKPSDQRARLRIVTMYWKDGEQWYMTRFCRQGILEDSALPYIDDEGESVNPMLLQSAYVDRENNRYGAVRRLIGPQDEENKRRSKTLHLLNVRQIEYESGAVDDIDEVRKQVARPDGAWEVNPGYKFTIHDASAQIAGQYQMMNYAAQRMEQIGPSASLQGKPQGDPSGRAIIASQQGGIIELGPLTDRHRHFKLRVYEAIWQRIRQFWTEERWVRVTDDENSMRFVGFNRKMTVAEKLKEEMEDDGLNEQQIEQEFQAMLQSDPQAQAKLQQQITTNVPAEMDMDIIIEHAPDTVTIQQEQFEELVKLISTGLPLSDPRMKLIIAASQLRDKKRLLDIIEGGEAPSEEQQQMQQLQLQSAIGQLQKLSAEIEEIMSKTEKNRASAMKDMGETDALDGQLDGQTQGPVQ